MRLLPLQSCLFIVMGWSELANAEKLPATSDQGLIAAMG